ncbi:MAG: hypothetical protein P8I31_02045, partial [Bacteroidia bacterium]|nr:hypothetical protein [Bacteroidia bacterium]
TYPPGPLPITITSKFIFFSINLECKEKQYFDMLMAFLTRLKATFCLTFHFHIGKKERHLSSYRYKLIPWEEHLNLEKPVK